MTVGQLIRTVRQRHGLSQARLARRTGTQQSAISRLENDEVSPTLQTLQLMLNAMGEEVELGSRPMLNPQDPLHHKDWMSRTPEERLRMALSWNKLAGQLQEAGRAAKAGQVEDVAALSDRQTDSEEGGAGRQG